MKCFGEFVGHTTMSCPHRVSIENGTIPARKRNASNPMEYVFDRQIRAGVPLVCSWILFV